MLLTMAFWTETEQYGRKKCDGFSVAEVEIGFLGLKSKQLTTVIMNSNHSFFINPELGCSNSSQNENVIRSTAWFLKHGCTVQNSIR